jgi:hypothetical protein
MGRKKILKVIVIEPRTAPKIIEIEDTLEAKQKIVGGLIECIPYIYFNTSHKWVSDKRFDIILNEEGKIIGLPYNFRIAGDFLSGTVIIIRRDNEGNYKSMTDSDIRFIDKTFIGL